jgi:hypothetical protein
LHRLLAAMGSGASEVEGKEAVEKVAEEAVVMEVEVEWRAAEVKAGMTALEVAKAEVAVVEL